MTSEASVGIALNALAESTRRPEDAQLWRHALEKLAAGLASRESVHAQGALVYSWRARLAADEQVVRRVYEHESTFWSLILPRWDDFDYDAMVILVEMLLWQSQLRSPVNVDRFEEALSLWPRPDQVPIARAWGDDLLLADYMVREGSPGWGFMEATHALLLRETQLLNNWVTLLGRLSTPMLVAIMETVPFDLPELLVDRDLPLGDKRHAIDSCRAMLATTDDWDDEEVEAAVYMFWDRLLFQRQFTGSILSRLRNLLVWHASLGSERSRESVEHALEHWPVPEEVPKLRQAMFGDSPATTQPQ